MQLEGPSPEKTIAQLLLLKNLGAGLERYYSTLIVDTDETLAVGAACALLDAKLVPVALLPRLTELSAFKAVKTRAFYLLLKHHEYDVARAIADKPLRQPAEDLDQLAIDATFSLDNGALQRIEMERYLQTGDLDNLSKACDAANDDGGWKKSLDLSVKLLLINPQEGRWAMQLCRLLADANQFDLLEQFCGILEVSNAFSVVSTVGRTLISRNKGTSDEARKTLDLLKGKVLPPAVERFLAKLRAELLEDAGKYEDAYRSYQRMNRLAQPEKFDRNVYMNRTKREAGLSIPVLPRDERTNDFIMLGFPRSGTTLLENALACHPTIETFEEIPSMASATRFIDKYADTANTLTLEIALKTRERYYREIDRRKRKTGATIFIDKLPILSGQAAFLEKLFPEKRYIFSIRHPFDVVLSCFKQNFTANTAMNNFTTFEDSCRAYDFVMTQWFKSFSLDSDRVCYVRYDDLVSDMRGQVARVLDFVGTDWNESVMEFAQRADDRAVKTPSYAKVRQGLSLGRQSAWENYKFLFRKPEARQLDAWVKFFGYAGL